MPGFANYDEIINAISSNQKFQQFFFQKQSLNVVSDAWYTLWAAFGRPPSGVNGTALTGTAITSATTGAFGFTNPTSPATLHLASLGLQPQAAPHMVMLYDRLLELPFNGAVTSGTFSGTTQIPSRDANGANTGAGTVMFVENRQAALSATPQTLTVTYTNDQSVGSHTATATTIASAAVNRLPLANPALPFIPLQTGDLGVQSVQSYTLGASITSTLLNIVIARPLVMLPINVTTNWFERELVMQNNPLPRIYDNTALAFLFMTGTTTTGVFHGRASAVEN